MSAVVRFGVVGAGAVGGYYAARLAQAGFDVSLVARGAHLDAIRARGLWVWSPLGDLVVRPRASADPRDLGPVDVVLYAVKTYDDDTALPLLPPLIGEHTLVVTLQNGVSSAERVAAVVGRGRVLAGPTYIATALRVPGLIEQTGTHRRIVFGEVEAPGPEPSARVLALAELLRLGDIQAEPVADARVPLWEKFIYLAPFAAVTGAARQPAGVVWSTPALRRTLESAFSETEAVARAEGIAVAPDIRDRIHGYMDALPPSTRSSLLIDLQAGKRIELDALAADVVRRGERVGVPTPVMATLAATLTPYAGGTR
ncbi:2-dehydropantoate 2-reductase [Luteitalea sp. TBR-22]|uniref:ketopantoate reductase family protein n=1 Tax=Luteitalea sp. TBR-22 TaxID=2802971 RepID=UPI001AF0D875|nr:2-dehydropantoate 2-reductase [Luteitalea sp. TBR-22]BCS35819.1 2-dehydropantoate 2-reductase [Luteitalea sp. TBR-22]